MKIPQQFSGQMPGIYTADLDFHHPRLVLKNTEQCYPEQLAMAPALRDRLFDVLQQREHNTGLPVFVLGRDFIAENGLALLPLPVYHIPELQSAVRTVVAATYNGQHTLYSADDTANWILRTLASAAERVNKDNNA